MTCSMSNKKPYLRCPACKSVNIKILHEDEDVIHSFCLECNEQFWKTKI